MPTNLNAAPRTAVALEPSVEGVGLSVVVPVFDEEESIPHFHAALVAALEELGIPWEVIYCDDGSTDRSRELLRQLASQDDRLRVICLRRNFGQTAALAAGFDHARADIVVALDADLQNDPRDIGPLIRKLEEGFDVVSGWRRHRKDSFFAVTLPSRIGNFVIGRATNVRVRDLGCTLTAYRRHILQDIHLYGEMHRFIPVWANSVGARVTELPVRHHPRRYGRSKYTISKSLRVLFDLIALRFLIDYRTRPLHFFGRIGLVLLTLGGASWGWTLTKWIAWDVPMVQDPFVLIGMFLGLAGLQVFLFGLLSELMMRTYYEAQGKKTYIVDETINVSPTPPSHLGPRRL